MIPYHLTQSSREAMASPSVSMEKGAYRMRAPRRRADTLPPVSLLRPQKNAQGGMTACTALLLVVLATAALSSFGTAYYLFSTRWDTNLKAVPFVHALETDLDVKAVLYEPALNLSSIYPDEKFLSYLPHSGFHNQRIAFENALVLSRMLNRTLLVPPIILSTNPVPYARFDILRKRLSRTKRDLRYCSRTQSTGNRFTPSECFTWTSLPWEWFVDLSQIKLRQRLVHRPSMVYSRILDDLHISEADIYTMADSHIYQFRFLDSFVNASSSLNHKFQETIQISQLALRPERLIQLGTLFGSSRLLLRRAENRRIRGGIRRSMAFTNSHLVNVSDTIAKELGGSYLGVHIRLGDGTFKLNRRANARQIWWNVVNGVLNLHVNDTMALERLLKRAEDPPPLRSKYAMTLANPLHSFNESAETPCRGRKYTSALLRPLNTPLFISTDSLHPLKDPTIAIFLDTFPCTFFLSDFPHLTATLVKLRNEDGVILKDYLLPFVDAMVVGKARAAVGTEGSTFSRFVQDVLWRTYHGWDILQRG